MEASHPQQGHIKQVIVVFLVAVLAGLMMYSSTDESALGILNNTKQEPSAPPIPSLSTDVLAQKELLQLNIDQYQRPQPTQIAAVFTRKDTPQGVEQLSAFDTHTGEEIILFWTTPATVQFVNVYKRDTKKRDEQLIVDKTTAQLFIDTNVQHGTSYEYRVVAVNTAEDNKEYYAALTPTVTITPQDTLAPQHPTNVSVTVIDTVEQSGLYIQWDAVPDEDIDQYMLFRSEQWGTRGTALATIKATTQTAYLDTDVQPNVSYYYTVVAYDAAGNGSSDNFTLPSPGNTHPFSPVSLPTNDEPQS